MGPWGLAVLLVTAGILAVGREGGKNHLDSTEIGNTVANFFLD